MAQLARFGVLGNNTCRETVVWMVGQCGSSYDADHNMYNEQIMAHKKMEQFQGTEYAWWRTKDARYLLNKDVWKTVIKIDGRLLSAMQVEDRDAKSQVLAYLQRMVSDTILTKFPGNNLASAI
jgi:hypothetical protein